VGGERRREKSLRIGVHHADAVVWEPVYRTHLRIREEGEEDDWKKRETKDGTDTRGRTKRNDGTGGILSACDESRREASVYQRCSDYVY
jgi:hypothetical protein